MPRTVGLHPRSEGMKKVAVAGMTQMQFVATAHLW